MPSPLGQRAAHLARLSPLLLSGAAPGPPQCWWLCLCFTGRQTKVVCPCLQGVSELQASSSLKHPLSSSSAPPKSDFTLTKSYLTALWLSQKSIWDASVEIPVQMGAGGNSEIWVLHAAEVTAFSEHEFFIITFLASPIHTLLENSKTICCTNKIQPWVTCKLVSVIYRAICFLYWLPGIPLKVWSNT